MTVRDILEITIETTNVRIINENNNAVLSTYDGKDSIDEKYNDYEVTGLTYGGKTLEIYVNED